MEKKESDNKQDESDKDSAIDKVVLEQLRPGVYIELPKSWFKHPFYFNFSGGMLIKNEKQIEKLKKFGFKSITIDLNKSEVDPLPLFEQIEEVAEQIEEEEVAKTKTDQFFEQDSEKRKEILHERTVNMQRCEKNYKKQVSSVKNIMKTLFSAPEEAIGTANDLINESVESLLSDREIVVNMMSDKSLDENSYFHSMNVSVLSLLLGKAINLDKNDMQLLGVGSLFHDIGKRKVDDKILFKTEKLNPAEQKILNLHVHYGVEMVSSIDAFPDGAVKIIREHHEKFNGTGFPRGLSGNDISILSRITAIANIYDNHCNHKNIKLDFTPYEALSFMFKHQRNQIDDKLFKVFVHLLGVYPPGSLVQLSDGRYGLVTSVNSEDLLNPQVILYDENIPREEAIIYDLMRDKDLTIDKNIRPANLPPEVHKYLNPRSNINYSFDTPNKK